jgi:phage portal protein BeeE/2'-5' RNA ligase
MSKRSKRKNKTSAKAQQANVHSEKAYVGGGYYGGYGYSQASPDMRPDEYGAAMAYTFNVAVSAAVDFWEKWLDGIQWAIKADGNDKELISSDMRRYPNSGHGAKFAHAVKFHEQGFKHSLFKSIAFSDVMYGETYLRFICNDFRVPQLLEWLNPLAVEPDVTMGHIRNYRYSPAEGYETLSPKEVAYRIAKRNSQNDLRGQSRVISAIDALNLEANQKRAFKSYFRNNMQLGGVISPSQTDTNLAPNQIMKMEDDLARNNKGAVNAGKWVIAPVNMNITPFDNVDAEKNYSVIQPLRDEILMAMGVYPQLVGDPSNASYDNTADMKRQWWETYGIPYAKEIEGYINDLVMPQLEPYTPVYFAFDFSPYEVEQPEVVSADFSAGFVDMFQAQELRGYDGNPKLKGIHVINGVPMHEDIIIQIAHRPPSQYALDYANAATAGQTPNVNADMQGIVKPIQPQLPSADITSDKSISEITSHYLTSKKATDKPAYAYVPLANNSNVLALQRELRNLFTGDAIEWQMPPTFHITLCYAGIASDEAISKIVSLINIQDMQFQPVQGNGIDVFETPDGKALHIRLLKNSVNDAMQADIYSAFMTEAYDISKYSLPENWNPHITLAYIPNEIEIDTAQLNDKFQWLDSVVIDANQVVIGRDDYDPVAVVTAPAYKSHIHSHLPEIIESDIDPLEELASWRKFITNGKTNKRPFSPVALRGDLGDMLSAAIESKDKQAILDAFHTARERIETRAKAIQATRLDFENSVADIMSKALASNNYGRQQWSTAMRKIIRSACTRAYVDGLINGGVLDGKLSEDDQDTLTSHIASQSQYVTSLGDEIFKTEDSISEAMANRKPSLWFSKSVMPMYDAGQLSANGNRMMEFAGDDGDESCLTCKRLKGQRHRHNDWARKGLRPDAVEDSDNFECGLWECNHHLIPVSAEERGSY